MTDRVAALLAESPAISRASRLAPPTLPVFDAFTTILPDGGLRPGSSLQVGGIGATSVALALAAKASQDAWTAIVGLPNVSLRAADELGVDLGHVVVVDEQTVDVFAAVVDAFDLVIACPPPQRKAPRINARVRERDAVLIVLGRMPESDLQITGSAPSWHGIGNGHGHLSARTVHVTATGRRAAARPREATIWLPDEDGEVRSFQDAKVTRLHA